MHMKRLKLVRGRINKTIKLLASLLGNNLACGEQNQTSLGQVRGATAEGNTQAVILLFRTEQIQTWSGNVTFWRATELEKENLLIDLSLFLSMGVHREKKKPSSSHLIWKGSIRCGELSMERVREFCFHLPGELHHPLRGQTGTRCVVSASALASPGLHGRRVGIKGAKGS